MVPRTVFREWALNTFPDSTDYWTFRKSVSLHMALIGFIEFSFNLTRLRPEMLQINQDSGHLHAAYFRLVLFFLAVKKKIQPFVFNSLALHMVMSFK